MTQAQTLTFTNRTTSPFRYDIVGSFLRPAELKAAREKFANHEINHDELKAVEDKCIKELVAKEAKAGLHAVTDGEFRRSYWHLDTFWALKGSRILSRHMATVSMMKKRGLILLRLKARFVLTARTPIWKPLSTLSA